MRRPLGVAWPRASIASSRCSSSRACVSVASGGGSSQARDARIARTPAGEFERERREIGLEDLRNGLCRQRGVRGLGPQPIADAGRGAPCATAALVGRGAGNRHGLEAAHAAVGIEALPSLEACIDDDAHAFDGEARFGEVRGDDDLAAPCGCRTQRRILCRGVEIAVQRQDQQRRIARAGSDGIAAAPDLRGARQEDEHVARIGLQRTQDDASSALLDGFGPAVDAGRHRGRVLRGDVEGAPLGPHGTCIAEHRRHRSAVQRRRHDEQAQVVAQVALRIECQRETEVRLQVALVELVEDHAADVFERRIALQSARQDALGHYLDARRSADAGFEPRAVAHELPRLRARKLRQSSCHGARRDPARLQHDDALVRAEPGLVQQRERNDGALARTRRRLEHRVAMRPQGRSQCGQRVEDRGGGQRKAQAVRRPCDYRAGNVHDWLHGREQRVDVGVSPLLMVLGGLAGAVLPALPGVPLVFGGLLVAAWADDFQRVGWITLTFLGVLTVASFAIDFAATAMGAKRVGRLAACHRRAPRSARSAACSSAFRG